MSATAVRRVAVAAQQYASRYRRGTTRDVEGRLVVRAFHLEPGVRRSRALDDALDRALDRLARTIGLEEVRR